jgi:hypothetical protein
VSKLPEAKPLILKDPNSAAEHDDHRIEALTPDGADHTLDVSSLPRLLTAVGAGVEKCLTRLRSGGRVGYPDDVELPQKDRPGITVQVFTRNITIRRSSKLIA